MRLLVVVFVLITCRAQAVPVETFMLICESESKSRRLMLGDAIIAEITGHASEGDAIHVALAPTHEHIASLVVPAGARGARLKRPKFLKEVLQLKQWFHEECHGKSSQLQLYGLPETIANLRIYPDSRCRVICVGDPVFTDKHYAGLNMVDQNGQGLVPLDGMLRAGADSPFAPGLASLPEGTVATWITRSSLWGPTGSRDHRQGLIRFYRLWFESQNGSMLARFSSSPAKAFDFTPAKGFVRLHARPECDDMRLAADATVQGSTDRLLAKEVSVRPGRQSIVAPKQSYLPKEAWDQFVSTYKQARQGVIVRLDYAADESPDTATDLDIFLVDNATGEELWYVRPVVEGLGVLVNDIRSGTQSRSGEPQLGQRYEFLCLAPGRDLSTCSLWVNKYVGVGKVLCEVSLFVDGQVVGAEQFTFDTPRGDLGREADNRGASQNWVQFDLTQLAGE